MTSQLRSRVLRLEQQALAQVGVGELLRQARERQRREWEALERLSPSDRAMALADRERQRRERAAALLRQPEPTQVPRGAAGSIAVALQLARRRLARHLLQADLDQEREHGTV